MMENDILDSLEDLGYEGPLSEEGVLEKALNEGPRSIQYTQLVEWITKELKDFTGLEDFVSAINDPSDEETFLMELSGFLREFGCPYTELSEGPISQRLNSKNKCLCLLDYLLTELQAMRMLAVNRPEQTHKTVELEKDNESEIARYMKGMLIALNFPKPPPGITAFQLFSKVESKIKEILNSIQSAHMSKPLLKARLSNKQWEKVNFVNSAMRQEYECRREMLLKRLDVTIQSFNWSDRAKSQEDKLVALYQPVRRTLSSKVETEIAHLLAAREDLLHIEKTSSGIAREKTKTDLNRVLIGKVPDRGGRAYEHDIPPPEMPSFMQRQQQPQQQRQGSARGGRGDHSGHGGRGGDHPRSGQGYGQQQQQQQQQYTNWGQNTQVYAYDQNSCNPAAAFFGSGGGGQVAYQPAAYTQGGYQQAGYQQANLKDGRGYGGYQQNNVGGYQGGGGGYQGSGGGYQGGVTRGGYQGDGGGYQGGRGGRGGGRRGGRGRARGR